MTITLRFDFKDGKYYVTENVDREDIKYYLKSPIRQFAESYRKFK